jgi:hypothetical protein
MWLVSEEILKLIEGYESNSNGVEKVKHLPRIAAAINISSSWLQAMLLILLNIHIPSILNEILNV